MKLKLTPEQIAYLQSLNSTHKKHTFLLEAIIENLEIKEKNKIEHVVFKDGTFSTDNPETIKAMDIIAEKTNLFDVSKIEEKIKENKIIGIILPENCKFVPIYNPTEKNTENSSKENSDKKYTLEDIKNAFIAGRNTSPRLGIGLERGGLFPNKDHSMDDYIKSLNEKR